MFNTKLPVRRVLCHNARGADFQPGALRAAALRGRAQAAMDSRLARAEGAEIRLTRDPLAVTVAPRKM